MSYDQIMIMLFGATAVWLSQDRRASWRRWACVLGMMAQPFWFIAAWKAAQWGILAINCIYTYAWARGIWTNWIRPEAK